MIVSLNWGMNTHGEAEYNSYHNQSTDWTVIHSSISRIVRGLDSLIGDMFIVLWVDVFLFKSIIFRPTARANSVTQLYFKFFFLELQDLYLTRKLIHLLFEFLELWLLNISRPLGRNSVLYLLLLLLVLRFLIHLLHISIHSSLHINFPLQSLLLRAHSCFLVLLLLL